MFYSSSQPSCEKIRSLTLWRHFNICVQGQKSHIPKWCWHGNAVGKAWKVLWELESHADRNTWEGNCMHSRVRVCVNSLGLCTSTAACSGLFVQHQTGLLLSDPSSVKQTCTCWAALRAQGQLVTLVPSLFPQQTDKCLLLPEASLWKQMKHCLHSIPQNSDVETGLKKLKLAPKCWPIKTVMKRRF